MTEADPPKKILVPQFSGRKGPKCAQNEVFQVLRKIDEWDCSDFLYEVSATLTLKIDLSYFFGKNLVLDLSFFRGKIGPN